MRNASAALAAALVAVSIVPAEAHQLDEYVHAAKISVARDRIEVDLTLTPGVAVAPTILSSIDGDGDRRLSPTEIRDYAALVTRNIVLRVDETPRPLTLLRVDTASYDELLEGVGTIRVQGEALVPQLRGGTHRLEFTNNQRAAGSVYLVNALIPDDPGIAIGAPQRDRLQRTVVMDVQIASANDLLVMFAMLGLAIGVRAGSGVFTRNRRGASTLRP